MREVIGKIAAAFFAGLVGLLAFMWGDVQGSINTAVSYIPESMQADFSVFKPYFDSANYWFPISEFFLIVGGLLLLRATIMVVKWLMELIPG